MLRDADPVRASGGGRRAGSGRSVPRDQRVQAPLRAGAAVVAQRRGGRRRADREGRGEGDGGREDVASGVSERTRGPPRGRYASAGVRVRPFWPRQAVTM